MGQRRRVVAIRRETINLWERRSPLSPSHVRQLAERDITVLVQPSNRRAFPIQDYVAAGAIPRDDISEADVIMSVKTVPIEELIPDKTYCFFSHTIKAQRENMPLLVSSPGPVKVWDCPQAHNYRDVHMATNALRDCGYEIALGYLPHSLGPLIFVFTGTGNVSQGAQELFRHMPHEYVSVSTLPRVARHGSLNKLYACVVDKEHHLRRISDGGYDPLEWEEHPERYRSTFATHVAPYASVIVNGIFWGPDHPRLLTIPDAKKLLTPVVKMRPDVAGEPTLPHRWLGLCDISADPGGSVEFMRECTTIDRPFCLYDAAQHQGFYRVWDCPQIHDSFDAPCGVLVCNIDNMPAQMPTEATVYFGDLLLPYIDEILKLDANEPLESQNIDPVVKDSVITSCGKLTPRFEYITDLRRTQTVSQHKAPLSGDEANRSALVLGAGFVSGPVVEYLLKKKINVTVASALPNELERVCRSAAAGDARGGAFDSVLVDVSKDAATLREMIDQHDLVVSLLPYGLHPLVTRACIDARTNVLTSSYLTEEMMALDEAARQAGVTVMMECGLDPGIDHMLAMQCIDGARQRNARVESFVSYCGGLPAPEFSDNPLRYKFSWSPKGVLQALLNPASFLRDGKQVQVAAGGAVLGNVEHMDFMPGFNLVGYPNRDSTKYADVYGIGASVKTLIRGTLRYEGFAEVISALQRMGFLSEESQHYLDPEAGPDMSWKELSARMLNQRTDIFPDSLREIAARQLGLKADAMEMNALAELGLFSDESVPRRGSPLDTLVSHLSSRLAYEPGERDLVVLQHRLVIGLANGCRERHDIELVAYGSPDGHSAMAQTVGYTAAIVGEMILNGEIQRPGMQRPMVMDVYEPTLHRLAKLGIEARTRVRTIQ